MCYIPVESLVSVQKTALISGIDLKKDPEAGCDLSLSWEDL